MTCVTSVSTLMFAVSFSCFTFLCSGCESSKIIGCDFELSMTTGVAVPVAADTERLLPVVPSVTELFVNCSRVDDQPPTEELLSCFVFFSPIVVIQLSSSSYSFIILSHRCCCVSSSCAQIDCTRCRMISSCSTCLSAGKPTSHQSFLRLCSTLPSNF